MIILPDYQISAQIHQSNNSLVYRGKRRQDKLPVIIKVLRQDYPTPIQLTRYKQEYQITHNLAIAGAIKAYSLEKYQNTLVIIFEDFGGESLKILTTKQRLTLREFLPLAISITAALGNIHAAKIIHKDINPSNIVYNPETQDLKIIDFGISTRLSQENLTLKNPDLLEGTLSYIAPEQTGRMNRPLDYRSDFYSLGVTFYELLTGRLPFEAEDSLELIYCHLAKQAIPPCEVVASDPNFPIPKVLSQIIIKLMAKAAEDGYQSAWGIQADLEECLRQLETTGTIEDFPIATQDIADQFVIPQKLYGREQEIELLLASFERIAERKEAEEPKRQEQRKKSKSELFLVSGYSGIGKSALVKEIYQPITAKKGYFISGKFDQYQRDIPYYAVIQALKKLIEQVLTESELELRKWQDRLQAALGVNGQVIVDIIPEVELIIGKQPAISELQPIEAENRFNLVFQNFIQVFAQLEHPLVLFLDDLQWADLASLKLIKLLVNAPDVNSLLLVGAYRDNEVNAAHPLHLTVEEIKEAKTIINEIALTPLELLYINKFVADTLNSSESDTEPLAELLQAKTNGNPFFLQEFIKSLYEEELLIFDSQTLSWQWELQQIKARQITDNVVDLMTQKINKLSDHTQEILKFASCIGNQFDLETLAIIAETSPNKAALSLHDAITQGLIVPLNEFYKSVELDIVDESYGITKQVEYKFVHDKIQQAAYSLIPEADKSVKHLQIGKLLLQNTPESEQEEKIFDLVNQFNKATELISNRLERERVIQLNLTSCNKCKRAAAYQSALKYVDTGIFLLGEDAWENQYKLTLMFHELGAELAWLGCNFSVMEQFANIVLERANSLLDKISVYLIKIQANISQNKSPEAIAIALQILQKFNVFFPETPIQNDFQQAFVEIDRLLVEKEIEDLCYLPQMVDQEKIAMVKIANSILTATFTCGSPIFPLLVCLSVRLSIKYGNIPASVFTYVAYGILACNILKNVDVGVRMAQLALKTASILDAKTFKPNVLNVMGIFILHRKFHIRETLPLMKEGCVASLEVGNFEHFGYNVQGLCLNSFWCGQTLAKLEQDTRAYCIKLEQLNQLNTACYCRIYWQSILNLIGVTENPTILSGEALEESESLLETISADQLYFYYVHKLMLCYLFEKVELALDYTVEVKKYLATSVGSVAEPAFYFYDSLNCLTPLSLSSTQTPDTLQRVEQNQTKLKKQWADYAPMNHQHKYLLVEAEKNAKIFQQYWRASELYELAIKGAKDNKYLNEEALAYELAAKFYLARGHNLVASTYMKQARYCYLKWDAKAKVKHLDDNYPNLLAAVVPESTEENSITTSSSTDQEALDLNTLIKTSQALAQITDFSQLLETLIKFVLENAGAEKGYLILVQADNLMIQGSGTAESITTLQALPMDNSPNLSQTIINYVYRTQENLVLDNACGEGLFINDEYISSNLIKSVLCIPILTKGKPIGILYLENNLAKKAFSAERLEILKLISAQAAISIKNALLHQQAQEKIFEYQVGGCLTINAPTYVVRQADIDLYQHLKKGHYCYILNSRHMGKSSLRVRIMNRLQTEGIICVALDLTMIGSQKTTIEQWYAGVIYRLVNSLKLSDKFDFRNWWHSLDVLSPVQRFSEFIEQILLPEIRGRIIIFIDEIDSVLSLSFKLDDFFAVIRACYNNRNENPEYQRLNFVLLGVATSSSLIQDKNCTPFNIGSAIALQGFQLHEVKPLIQGLASKYHHPQILINQVLNWTGGQPFLTQKICSLMVDAQIPPTEGKEIEWVDNLVQKSIISNWESKDDPQHFKTIRDRLVNSSHRVKLLQLYQQILNQQDVMVDESNEHKELLLSGLVKQEGNKFQVYNRIYLSVFDLSWCQRALNSPMI